MTFFPAVGLIHRGEADRVVRNQQFIRHSKCDYQRTLGQVDWKGKEIDPFWPEYPEQLAMAIDSGYAAGIRTQLTAFGGDCTDPIAAARIMHGVLESRREKIMMIEDVNEGNLSSEQAVAIGRIFADLGLPHGVGLGDQGISTINECGRKYGATVSFYHTSRALGDKSDPGGVYARMVRQCWDFKELDGCRVENEPAGIASSVNVLADPFIMAAKRAADIICGAGAFCIHAGAGVFAEYMTGTWGVRTANLDEVVGLSEMAEAVSHAADHLPDGIEEWTKFNTNQPIKFGGRLNKLYGARSGNQFAEIAIGCDGSNGMQAKVACDVKVANPATGELVFEGHLAKDQSVALPDLWAHVVVANET